jgi:hypothetical protein
MAQVNGQPTDPPIVTAENDSWYRRGEAIDLEGDLYYPAGPTVFFNGNVMFRSAQYNGVPLYSDSTIEPYSVVFVPVGRNLMRPYERKRSGELAGTTGTRTPSFPGGSARDDDDAFHTADVEGTTGRLEEPARAVDEVVTRVQPRRGRPFSYDSVSVQFRGETWVMAGPMTEMLSDLVEVAEYKGFPVYAKKGRERARIYLPLVPGRVAPFTPKH